MIILIDTREKKPFAFPDRKTRTATLVTGDYSILGNEIDGICIERKGVAEMFGMVGKSRPRFERELVRMAKFQYAAVVVEGGLCDVLRRPKYSTIDPRVIVRYMASWSVRYKIPFWLCGSKRNAQAMTLQLLSRFYAWGKLIGRSEP